MNIPQRHIHLYYTNAICPNCKNIFIPIYYGKNKFQKYCSKSCSVKAQHTRKEIGFENNNKNPKYIDGRSRVINYCQCGRKTNNYRNKLCYICFRKKLIILNKTLPRKRIFAKPRYGEKNNFWKGDNVGYAGIHCWLIKKFGKASRCENKYCLHKSQNFEWSLLKGKKYQRRRYNFWQLCVSCHRKYDNNFKNRK